MRLHPCARAAAAVAALILGAFAPAAAPVAAAVDDGAAREITVLGVADLRGHVERVVDESSGAVTDPGAVTLACEVARSRRTSPDSVFVSAGDNVESSADSASSVPAEDRPTLEALGATGLDASALGTREIAGGASDLVGRILPDAAFPYLASNYTGTALDAEGVGDGTAVKDVNGVKVGIVGVTTDDLPTLAPAASAALTPAPAAATANARAAALRSAGAQVVVVMAHADASALAAQLSGDVDAVIGAGVRDDAASTTSSSVARSVDGQDIAVVTPAGFGRELASVTLSYEPSTGKVSVSGATTTDLRASDCTEDAYGVAAIVPGAAGTPGGPGPTGDDEGGARAAGIGSDFLRGSADGTAPGASDSTESTAANMVADAYAHWASGSDVPRGGAQYVVGLADPRDLRADYLYAKDPASPRDADGTLTIAETRAALPEDSPMGHTIVTGAQLREIIARQWWPETDRGLVVLGTSSNVSILLDQDAADDLEAVREEIAAGTTTTDAAADRIAEARGGLVESVAVDGVVLADDDSVLLASTSALLTGGEDHLVPPGVSPIGAAVSGRDVVTDYLTGFADAPARASYGKHQIGLSDEVPQADSRTVDLHLTGLSYSNDAEKPKGVTAVRYSYRGARGDTVTSGTTPVDSGAVRGLPETGRATLQIAFDDAATARCSSGSGQYCYLATVELLDADGTVVSGFDYELATVGTATVGATAPDEASGGGSAVAASRRPAEVVVGPTPAPVAEGGSGGFDLARSGASVGVGLLALVLVAGGVLLLMRRRRGGASDDGDAGSGSDPGAVGDSRGE